MRRKEISEGRFFLQRDLCIGLYYSTITGGNSGSEKSNRFIITCLFPFIVKCIALNIVFFIFYFKVVKFVLYFFVSRNVFKRQFILT